MENVRNYMAESLLSIAPSAGILEALRMMSENEVHSLLVEESGQYIGIVTNNDLSRKVVTKNLDVKTTVVSKIMTYPIVKLESTKSMEEASEIMREKDIHHLLVTENDQPLGILSINDYVKYLAAAY